MFLAEPLTELAGELAHNRDARVALFVNAVAETHDFFFARQPLQHPGLGAVRGADVPEHPHRFLVCAAVQRAFKRAEARGQRGIDVGHGGSGHPRGKGGGVEFVVGIKHEDGIEDFRPPRLRRSAGKLVEKISGVREVGFGGKQVLAMRHAPTVGDERRDFRRETHRLAQVGLVGMIVQFRIECRQHRDTGTEGVHWMGARRQQPQHLDDRRRQRARRSEFTGEISELLLAGQFTAQ